MIYLVEKERSADERFVAEVTELVNRAYAVAEQGIWLEGTDRTSPAEIAAMIDAGHLVAARDGDALIGVMRLQRLPTGEGEFGMLVADPARRGAGIGRDLIAYAEDWARSRSLPAMQLELLFPSGWTHPVKQFLRDWYQRLGYRVVRHGHLGEDYPDLVPRLATECDFLVFHKAL
ncbi:GNAT family N-acetyltransferase [Actinoplanes sp. KI2]|uniref:GNAT family N-acetyltransferase n=1 Tax=Actinoplanes sp. KI2 TaxID=2983315 RepID=UPI0021D5E7D8|nr:GNAT family N-acetyltransferase [Actinoplanes sp. KI2]MCU7726929.1 GNAT family N-acetyltransferase [Actinoplanes sp. KI2]